MADEQDQSDQRGADDGPDADGGRAKDDEQSDQDFVSVEALSAKELQYIVGNDRYRDLLSDLLSPYLEAREDGRDSGSGDSVDHTNPSDQPNRGTDHTPSVRVHTIRGQRAGVDTSTLARSKPRKRPSCDREVSDVHRKKQRLESPPPRKRSREDSSPGPAPKRASRDTDSGSDMDGEIQCFDPELETEDKEEFKMKVPRVVERYVEKHFRRSLSKEERTAMLKKHPKPDTEAAAPPKLDSFVADYAGKNLDKAHDAHLARIQGAVLHAANPLTSLWSDLENQGLTQDSKAAIYVSDILDTIQRSLVLLGNANNLISETRRETALESIHPSLKKYGRGDFSKAGNDLFGQDFKDGLVKKVEADSALAKAVNIVTRSTNLPTRGSQKQSRGVNFFHGSRTSRYGAVSGRIYKPYNHQGKGKYAPGKPQYRKGSIFSRLGPHQPGKAGASPSNSGSQQQK